MLLYHRNTLTSQELIDYMGQHNILVWAGNVRETEAFQGKHKRVLVSFSFALIPCFIQWLVPYGQQHTLLWLLLHYSRWEETMD